MQVKDLKDYVANNAPKYTHVAFSNIEFTPSRIAVKGTDFGLELDEFGLKKFSSFLGIPKAFLPKVDDQLKIDIVDHFLEKNPFEEALISYTPDGVFNTAHPANTMFIRDEMMVNAIENVFRPDAQVKALDIRDGFKVSIITEDLNTEPRVNDVTNGGLRITAPIGEAPTLATYLERLVCSNGMVVPSYLSNINLRGRTVDEIIVEMEQMATLILGNEVNSALDNWSHMTEIAVADPAQLIHRFCREYNLGSRIEAKMLDRVGELEGSTYYDIINLITSMQHEAGVSDAMRNALQLVGGTIVANGGGHRCNTCQHPLD